MSTVSYEVNNVSVSKVVSVAQMFEQLEAKLPLLGAYTYKNMLQQQINGVARLYQRALLQAGDVVANIDTLREEAPMGTEPAAVQREFDAADDKMNSVSDLLLMCAALTAHYRHIFGEDRQNEDRWIWGLSTEGLPKGQRGKEMATQMSRATAKADVEAIIGKCAGVDNTYLQRLAQNQAGESTSA
tara:strand:+ start:565 stop:1122 length:558 start_codon:yes stop_codon:yes gene_type:complete